MVFSRRHLTFAPGPWRALRPDVPMSAACRPCAAQGQHDGAEHWRPTKSLRRIGDRHRRKQRPPRLRRIGIICGERLGGLQVAPPRCFTTMTLRMRKTHERLAKAIVKGPITTHFLRSCSEIQSKIMDTKGTTPSRRLENPPIPALSKTPASNSYPDEALLKKHSTPRKAESTGNGTGWEFLEIVW